MARRPHREKSQGASQRQLRVGELVRHALAVIALTLIPAASRAEVCDKVGGAVWSPGGSPLWSSIPWSVWAFFLVGALLVALFNQKWMWVVAGMLSIGIVAFYASLHMSEADILAAAVQEGCLSSRHSQFDFGAMIAFSAVCLLLGFRAHRSSQTRSV